MNENDIRNAGGSKIILIRFRPKKIEDIFVPTKAYGFFTSVIGVIFIPFVIMNPILETFYSLLVILK